VKVTYSNQAVNDLQQFNAVDRTLIAKKIHYLAENFEQLKQSKKVSELKGTRFTGQYRYTIARRIRAIFRSRLSKPQQLNRHYAPGSPSALVRVLRPLPD
jgi:mRNA-degrading endonuclease RelE of RelBE toxin-antitoxin system